jgi:hypothetical protein
MRVRKGEEKTARYEERGCCRVGGDGSRSSARVL